MSYSNVSPNFFIYFYTGSHWIWSLSFQLGRLALSPWNLAILLSTSGTLLPHPPLHRCWRSKFKCSCLQSRHCIHQALTPAPSIHSHMLICDLSWCSLISIATSKSRQLRIIPPWWTGHWPLSSSFKSASEGTSVWSPEKCLANSLNFSYQSRTSLWPISGADSNK